MEKNKVSGVREKSEIKHGKILAGKDTESIWGWGSPAGKVRALKRAGLIVSRTGLVKDKYVLEVGCGTGVFTEIFARSGANIVALDISADLLMEALDRKIPSDSIQFIEKNIEDYNPVIKFEVVIGSSVLHHLNIEPCLKKIYALLKPGGIMCFAEPNMLNPQIALQKNIPRLKKMMGDSPGETAFTKWFSQRLMKKTGFVKIEIIPFDWLHPAVPEHLIDTVCRLDRILTKIPLVRELAGSLLIKGERPV